MKMNNLLNAAESVANSIITSATGRSGLLAKYINQQKNPMRVFGNALVGDLGDAAPFFYWLGKISNNETYMKWAETQVNLAIELSQMSHGLFAFFDVNEIKPPSQRIPHLFPTYDMDDTILGIVLMYELTRKKHYEKAAEKFFRGLEFFATEKGFICTHAIPSLRLKVPFSMPHYCGVYIEEICRLCDMSGDETLLSYAKRVANAWIETPSFKNNGLFTFRLLSSRFSPTTFFITSFLTSRTLLTPNTAVMMKPNTNLLFGLIALYGKTREKSIREAIIKWLDSVQERMKRDDIFCSIWDAKTEKGSIVSLATNHAMMDVLLEIYTNLSNKTALELARKCADAWLERQHSCGLVAEGIGEKVLAPFRKESAYMLPPDTSRLDSQVDFAVTLAKLYELTNHRAYLEASRKIVEGILKWHGFREGYCEFVNLETLEKQGFTIETKYLTLLKKILLLHHELSQGATIYKNDLLRNLIRDR